MKKRDESTTKICPCCHGDGFIPREKKKRWVGWQGECECKDCGKILKGEEGLKRHKKFCKMLKVKE